MNFVTHLSRPKYGHFGVIALTAWMFAWVPNGIAAQQATESSVATSWSPEWTKDLVIYAIAPKAFVSPNGPESGTFESLRAKLPYLEDLGITGIWLAGHALSDPHHFFNIWMGYATIEPDQIDPSLGTPDQFKEMINEAHRRGIKVFLDVTTHGLMPESSVVKQHPEWFRGGSWGMVDFDWSGGHTDLNEWWVRLWTEYVTRYGVDGFRLDLGMSGHTDLWARIRKNATAAGHPIVIFVENDRSGVLPGVADFAQWGTPVFQTNWNAQGDTIWPEEPTPILTNDIPGFYDMKFGRAGRYEVEIQYADGTSDRGVSGGEGPLQVHLDGLVADRVSYSIGDYAGIAAHLTQTAAKAQGVTVADGISDLQLTVNNVAVKRVNSVTVTSPYGTSTLDAWVSGGAAQGRPLAVEGEPPYLRLYLATRSYGSSIALSIPDVGRERHFPDNPYSARGSRALFGYSFLFTPMVPLFMAGDEFDATFHAIPWMSPDVFGGKDPGQGHMLYGSMLDWRELDQPRHRSMVEDVKRMLVIRKQEGAVLAAHVRGDLEPQLTAVVYKSDIDVPRPYMRWNGDTAIVVVANRNVNADAHLKLNIPVEKLHPTSGARYKVTDLWRGGKPKVYSAAAILGGLHYTVKRDKVPLGGLGLLKIETIR